MVKLIKLEVEGFGKFKKNKVIEFKEGINFITGLNEAGKSTILEGILASMFKYTSPKIKPYICWTNPDICRASLTYKTDKGEIFRVTSDYKNARRKLEKIDKGKAKEISSAGSTVDNYIKEHFGFDEQKVFENTTFIRQSQMAILGDRITKNKLKNMVEEVLVGTGGASATKSIQKIKKIEKDSRKKAESLVEDLYELKEELREAEENKGRVVEDSEEHEEVSKSLIEKQKKFDELKIRKEKFDKKEKHAEDHRQLDKEIKNIDKVLSNIEDSVRKREKLIDKQKKEYKGFDSISKENFSTIKENIKRLESIKTSLETYAKTGGKRKVVQETLNIKYVVLFIVGLLLSIALIGIPLAIYAYKRMKKEVTIEEEDIESQNEIKNLNKEKEKLEEKSNQISKNIKDFEIDTFVDLFGDYNETVNKAEGLTESIEGFIKNILERNEVINNEDENIKKITKIKTDLLNSLTITKNNLNKYKLVNLTDKDIDELEDLEEEVKRLNNRNIELKTSINKTKELVKSPEEIQEEVDSIEQKIQELKEKAEEFELSSRFLEMAETSVQHKFTPAIESNSKELLNEITDEKYSDLKIDEETLDIQIKAPEIKDYVDVELLSQGAKDQVYFTVRTTMSDLLSGNINIPLIFDDPFHNFDDIRLEKTITAMKKLSKNKQIILISHKPYHKEFKNFADNIVEMK